MTETQRPILDPVAVSKGAGARRVGGSAALQRSRSPRLRPVG